MIKNSGTNGLIELTSLIFNDHCDIDNDLVMIGNVLKEMFLAYEVKFHGRFISGRTNNSFFLPIHINGKNIGYYEIVNLKNSLTDVEIEFIGKILLLITVDEKHYSDTIKTMMEQSENIDRESLIDNETGFYNSEYYNQFGREIGLVNNGYIKCLCFNVVGFYDSYVEKFKLISDSITKVFGKDIILRFDKDDFVIFIKNEDSVTLKWRISYLEDILNELGFSLVYGISSDYGCADVNRMVSLARRNMEAFRRNNICKGIKSY